MISKIMATEKTNMENWMKSFKRKIIFYYLVYAMVFVFIGAKKIEKKKIEKEKCDELLLFESVSSLFLISVPFQKKKHKN